MITWGKSIIFKNIITKNINRNFRNNITYKNYIYYFAEIIDDSRIQNIFDLLYIFIRKYNFKKNL